MKNHMYAWYSPTLADKDRPDRRGHIVTFAHSADEARRSIREVLKVNTLPETVKQGILEEILEEPNVGDIVLIDG